MANRKYLKDDDDSRLLLFFLPGEGIDFDVLACDLPCYLGHGARVKLGNHPDTGRPGYFIKSAVAMTTDMIQDLKADSLRWEDERRQYNISYSNSHTHRNREAKAASYKQSGERERQDGDEDRYPYTQSNLLPRNPTYPSNLYYSAPPKGFEYPSGQRRDGPTDTAAGGISVNYRHETTLEVESAYERTTPGNQYSSAPRYTAEQTKDAEIRVVQLLKSHGQNATRQQFDRLVSQQLERLYGSQQRQYQSKPMSQSQGGQKPPSGYIPSPRFPEPGGPNPPPPYALFPDSGGPNPPQGSAPLTKFSGSDNEPTATQPEYGGSYGFTAGGPERVYHEGFRSLPTDPSGEPYDPRK